MNIVIATDENYVMYYKVMILSLCKKNTMSINVFLLCTEDLSQKSINEIDQLVKKYDSKLYVIKIDIKRFKDFPTGNWSIEAWFRLMAFELLPIEIERALWLDGDIIINKSIEDLYLQSFDDKYFVACEDVTISKGKNKEELARIGFCKEQVYVNTGVLLMNLKKLRQDYTWKYFEDYIRNNKNRFGFVDQSLINIIFYGKIKLCDEKQYNCIVGAYHYTKEKELLNEVSIFHFASVRPWKNNYRKHFNSAISGEVWWKYARGCGYLQKYLKWKIVNTISVVPWQITYRTYQWLKGRKKIE